MDTISVTAGYWRAFFEGSPEGVALLEAVRGSDGAILDFRWLDANARALTILGAAAGDLLGFRLLERNPDLKGAGVIARYAAALERGVTGEFELQLPPPLRREADAQGAVPTWYAVTAIPCGDDHLIMQLRSIGEYKAVLKEAIDLMNRDDLTGLANRRYLKARFWVMRSRHPAFGLLFFDLDGFKGINDSYGHEIGDEALRTVARRLEQNVRPDEVVARIGGDEFAVLLRSSDRASVDGVLRRLLAAIAAPVHIGERAIALGSSAGAALYPEDGDGFDALLRRADQRMYRHKRGDA